MKPTENIKNEIKNMDFKASDELKQKMLASVLIAQKSKQHSTQTPQSVWRIIMKSNITKLATAAVVIAAILVGVTHFGGSIDGTSVAWAQQALEALEKVEVVTYRQTVIRVRDYRQDDVGGLWERRYYAKNAYRRDIYDDSGEIINTQWTLPDGENSIQREVSFKYECYWDEAKQYKSYYDGLMNHLHRYVSFLDRASRILGTEFFDEKECLGFEISPGKYDDFTVTQPTLIWFDIATKLPARIERRGIQSSYDPSLKLTIIHDQFDYYTEVPADMFTPLVPQGFINAHRDEIIANSKGDLVYADVPQHLRNEIISAIKNTQTVFYQQHLETIADDKTNVYPARDHFVEKNSWREDRYAWKDELKEIYWFNAEKQNILNDNRQFEENNFRLTQTTVDYENKAYSVKTKEHSFEMHPLERILFMASLINEADRFFENVIIDNIECFGFEISAIKRGDNPPKDKDRMWFDVETKLPVRIEKEYWQSDDKTKSLHIIDEFQWNTELPEETFIPSAPEGFKLVEESN